MSMLRRRAIIRGKARLPNEYQEVAYVQSDGNQVILSDIVQSVVGRWELMAQFLTVEKIQINGALYAPAKLGVDIGVYNGNWFMRNGSNNAVKLSADTDMHFFVVDQINKQCLIDNEVVSTSHIDTSNCLSRFRLFARTNSGKTELYCTEKIFESSFFDRDGVKISHMIPCFRKADHKPGLYDMVTDVFLTNQGTGNDFTVGPDAK